MGTEDSLRGHLPPQEGVSLTAEERAARVQEELRAELIRAAGAHGDSTHLSVGELAEYAMSAEAAEGWSRGLHQDAIASSLHRQAAVEQGWNIFGFVLVDGTQQRISEEDAEPVVAAARVALHNSGVSITYPIITQLTVTLGNTPLPGAAANVVSR